MLVRLWSNWNSFSFNILFTYLFLAALGLFCCKWAFFRCREWELFFVAVQGLLLWSTDSRHVLEQLLKALELRLSSCDLAALQQLTSSHVRDRTRFPHIGRWILNHLTIREVWNWSSCMLLEGWSNGPASMKNCSAFSYKCEHTPTIWSGHFTP